MTAKKAKPGKIVGHGTYVHLNVLPELDVEWQRVVLQAAAFAELEPEKSFYGKDKPLHVSHGPEHSRQIVLMQPGPSGRLVPKVVSSEAFVQST